MSLHSNLTKLHPVLFVKIELSGLTLRYASENCYAVDTDGSTYFWEGRVMEASDIQAGFNDFRSGNALVSNMSVTLFNGKANAAGSTLDTYLSSYFWGNKTVSIFLENFQNTGYTQATLQAGWWKVGAQQYSGPGKRVGPGFSVNSPTQQVITLSTANILFKGVTAFPNTFQNYNEEQIAFKIFDNRYTDQILVNPNVFQYGSTRTATVFPYISQSALSKQIPVIYGDFSLLAIATAFLTDNTTATNREFKIADSSRLATGQNPITSIDQVLINGVGTVYASTDLTTATFTINQTQFEETSSVFVACKGKTRGTQIASVFGGSGSSLLEHPAEILYDLLTYHLGVATGDIDASSFTTYQAANTALKAKAYIAAATAASDLIDALTFEFGLDLYSLNGKFSISPMTFVASSSPTAFTQDNLFPKSYEVSIDTNRIYFNQLALVFDPTYDSSAYLQGLSLSNIGKKAAHGLTTNFQYACVWNHDESQLDYRFGRLLYIASQPVQDVYLEAGFLAFLKNPNDQISLTYHIFSAAVLYIRSIAKNVFSLKSKLECWYMGALYVKNWAASGATTPANYAAALAATYAVYHSDYTVTLNFNDRITITRGGTTKFGILNAGNYGTLALLVAEINRAILDVSIPVTCAYDSSTAKFTFTAGDATNFTISWTTQAEFGRSTLGFDVATDDTGATSYTSDYVCVFDGVNQVSTWD